jgi:hypothetical protein
MSVILTVTVWALKGCSAKAQARPAYLTASVSASGLSTYPHRRHLKVRRSQLASPIDIMRIWHFGQRGRSNRARSLGVSINGLPNIRLGADPLSFLRSLGGARVTVYPEADANRARGAHVGEQPALQSEYQAQYFWVTFAFQSDPQPRRPLPSIRERICLAAYVGDASRSCSRCGMQMRHLADLPSFGLHPTARIYRCYHCNNVISDPNASKKKPPEGGSN